MAFTLHITQLLNLSILAADAAGNPVTPVTWDSDPVWTNDTPATATLEASTDGTTAVLTPVLVGGTTNVGVTGIFNGASFSATFPVTVVAGALASISIVGNAVLASPTPPATPAP